MKKASGVGEEDGGAAVRVGEGDDLAQAGGEGGAEVVAEGDGPEGEGGVALGAGVARGGGHGEGAGGAGGGATRSAGKKGVSAAAVTRAAAPCGRRPVHAGEDAGERAGVAGDGVGEDGEGEGGEAGGVAVGVEREERRPGGRGGR